LAQASTESQGPWDSNYQIEDDFSWFLPGKKGDHDIKLGARYNYTELRRVSQINQNGTFRFNTDLPFDAANPRTYPERFTIRIGQYDEYIKNHTIELFAQDKWTLHAGTTLSLGLRYDLEIIPLDEADNPLFPAGHKKYPIDKNNFGPRIGVTHALDEARKSVVRGGYGIFYNRTILGAIDDTIEFPKYSSSAVVNFPNNSADPGPSAGRFPTDPFLVNGPFVNRALLSQLYPPGALPRNAGDVIYDSPNRSQPYAHQFTVGYIREMAASLALHADYVRMVNKDMFLARNLNPMVRANTSRTGPITRLDAFGVLGEPYIRQQLGRPGLVLAVVRAGHGQQPERYEHVPGPDQSQPGQVEGSQ
ncbi:MAG: TonB-dependent receptor, partial [Acidobacteria bacterium]|nr:TonB-dependent receptor [Acidobacteriota bacterium]